MEAPILLIVLILSKRVWGRGITEPAAAGKAQSNTIAPAGLSRGGSREMIVLLDLDAFRIVGS